MFFSWFSFSFKYSDHKLQRLDRPGQPQTEVLSSGFGNFLSSVADCGSRDRGSQALRAGGNSEVGRSDGPQCHQSVNMLTEHLLCARRYSGCWWVVTKMLNKMLSVTPREGGRQADKQLGCTEEQSVAVRPEGSWEGGDVTQARENQKGFREGWSLEGRRGVSPKMIQGRKERRSRWSLQPVQGTEAREERKKRARRDCESEVEE